MSRDQVISSRVSDDEYLALLQVADAGGVSLSELVRHAALALIPGKDAP